MLLHPWCCRLSAIRVIKGLIAYEKWINKEQRHEI